jgi:glyoxylase-like metal-dependent hydrolase (beta-lactamase superfamily II)
VTETNGTGGPPLPHPYFREPVRNGAPRLAPVELRRLLEGPQPPLLLDVRPDAERRLARLGGDRWIPLGELPDRAGELPRDRPMVVYCHYGGIAERAASHLRRNGFEAVALLEGGLDEYARLADPTVPRYREVGEERPLLQQFPNPETGCLAYLLTDPTNGEAVVIDPGAHVEPYLAALRSRGAHLVAILETHTHADHLSGHAALHARTDAPIWLGRRSRAEFPHRRFGDGESLAIGPAELLVQETPGHTLDHLSLGLDGAVFTGDTLLAGSCGRTDLGEGDPGLLWESLMTKLARLPDETEVFPAHYGPRHGLPPPERYSTTIGFERRTNEALAQPTREAFVSYMTEGWPPRPAECDRIVSENLRH